MIAGIDARRARRWLGMALVSVLAGYAALALTRPLAADAARIADAGTVLLVYVIGCLFAFARPLRHSTMSAAEAANYGRDPVVVAFASQTGQAETLAWRTAKALQAEGTAVRVLSLGMIDRALLESCRRLLLLVSTTGEGDPPDGANRFVRTVMSGTTDLSAVRFGLLSLGDRDYKAFCGFGRALDLWLRGCGAQPLFDTVEMHDGDPQALRVWQEQLGTLAGRSVAGSWTLPGYGRWRLAERRLLNPGSFGAPIYHLALTPSEEAGPWQAGDIAEILIEEEQSGEGSPVFREYSIASLPADGKVELLVRQMRYPDGRLGIGSGWLTQGAEVGEGVMLRLRSNPSFHAPPDDRPLILIGSGTGFAGLRAHIKARAAAGHARNWLLFGERSRAHDFLYRTEIAEWQGCGILPVVDLAFSRDEAQRVYVQDRLAAAGDRLRCWVSEGAAIYVCGSRDGMAQGVDAVLRALLGQAALDEMAADGRYRRDIY